MKKSLRTLKSRLDRLISWILIPYCLLASMAGLALIWMPEDILFERYAVNLERLNLSVALIGITLALISMALGRLETFQTLNRHRQLLDESEKLMKKLEKESEHTRDLIIGEAEDQQSFRLDTTRALNLMQQHIEKLAEDKEKEGEDEKPDDD